MIYVVKYSGKFGFIKPWTAVRDGETFSQQFLTPSIIEGIEKKLFPELLEFNGCIKKIIRHRLKYDSMDSQQEQTQTHGWEYFPGKRLYVRGKLDKGKITRSILIRNVMINPVLYLAFKEKVDAEKASKEHICLCRNEDVMLPDENVITLSEQEFDALNGFELRFGESENSFLVGYNRFDNATPMYGWLEYNGNSVL
ncbi:hypothetical protein [uncultured Bacteroides sp.]|uniref:hypothetical protein n=1 Tax=uncultured Bacteroides sp. TaxID=162156 RepID=UPI0025F7AC59|nr:hypothetical protein [uncultured Bacteroides sp.]